MKKNKDHSCQPPSGKTYLTIGQDFFSIQEYLLSQYNASLEQGSTRPLQSFVPAVTMFYTDIQELKGLDTPVDYGSGIEYAGALAEAFPESGIQIGLWLNGTQGCRDIVSGVLDNQIHQLYSILDKLDVPKVFLRVGYEFDNPWFGYSEDPQAYRQAFRKMVKSCETQLHQCHEKIAFCWHSWAAPKVAPLQDFYPGNQFVDWIGISIFQQLYPWANNNNNNNNAEDYGNDFAGGTRDQIEEVLDFAQRHNKPIMIAESTPFGGMNGQPPIRSSTISWTEDDVWELWYQPTLDLIEDYDIGMWSYINCDWDSQPMWHGVGFGDTRLSSSRDVMKRWQNQVLGNKQSRFLTTLDCHKAHSSSSSSSSSRQPTHAMSATRAMFTFDSFSMIFPAMCAVIVLCLLLWLVRRLCCKLRVDSATGTSIPSRQERQGYGSIPRAREDKGSSWSLNL